MKPRPISNDGLARIAGQFGTPTYVYLESVVRDRVADLRAMADVAPDLRLLYAVKANDSPALLKVMLEEGLGVDVVSLGELELVLALGWDPSRIFFSANNPADEELERASQAGAVVNFGEPDRLAWYADCFPGRAVCLRLNLMHGAGHHDHVITGGRTVKFGISPDDLSVIRRLDATGAVRVVGLHQHIGSGNLDPAVIGRAMAGLAAMARGFEGLEFVNFGGGIGVPYRPDEPPVDLSSLAGHLQEAAARLPAGVQPWLEPGRFLVAEAGLLLVRTVSVKSTGERRFAGTNSGMNHLVRPAFYEAYHEVTNVTNPTGPEREYDVVGNICESSDFFARQRLLPEIRVHDLLGIWDAGAYGMSMSSEYNMRPRPAEVLVDASGTARLIRRRMTARDMSERSLADYRAALAESFSER